jgi:hypothetical protein
MKKKIFMTILAVMVLVLCYLIGQYVVLPRSNKQNTVGVETTYYWNLFDSSTNIEYTGLSETTDTPGNITVGRIDDDSYGKWILMTPRTGFKTLISVDNQDRTLVMDYVIHKDVASVSDGMTVDIKLLNDGGEVVFEQEDRVNGDEIRCEIPLTEYKGCEVALSVEMEDVETDESGDWLVVREGYIR